MAARPTESPPLPSSLWYNTASGIILYFLNEQLRNKYRNAFSLELNQFLKKISVDQSEKKVAL